jgi:hypothetical protein
MQQHQDGIWANGLCDCTKWYRGTFCLSFFATGTPFAVIMHRTRGPRDSDRRCGMGYQTSCCVVWTATQIVCPIGVCPLTLIARYRTRESMNIHSSTRLRDWTGDVTTCIFVPQFVIAQSYDTIMRRTSLEDQFPSPPRVVNTMN